LHQIKLFQFFFFVIQIESHRRRYSQYSPSWLFAQFKYEEEVKEKPEGEGKVSTDFSGNSCAGRKMEATCYCFFCFPAASLGGLNSLLSRNRRRRRGRLPTASTGSRPCSGEFLESEGKSRQNHEDFQFTSEKRNERETQEIKTRQATAYL
jgi:hypothetical protein